MALNFQKLLTELSKSPTLYNEKAHIQECMGSNHYTCLVKKKKLKRNTQNSVGRKRYLASEEDRDGDEYAENTKYVISKEKVQVRENISIVLRTFKYLHLFSWSILSQYFTGIKNIIHFNILHLGIPLFTFYNFL